MFSHNKRDLFKLLAASAALAGLPAARHVNAQSGPAPVKVRLIQPTSSLSYSPIYVARNLKFFEAEGLQVESSVTGGDGPDIQALAAGEADFAVSPPTHLLTLYQQGGRSLQGIAAMVGKSASIIIIRKEIAEQRGLRPNTPFTERLKMLKGLSIGTTVPGSLTWNLATHYVKRAGLKPQVDVQIVAAGSGAAAIAAIEKKIVDLYVLPSPNAEQVVARGLAVEFANPAAGDDPELLEFLHAILYVRLDYAKNNPDVTRRMTRALLRASRWIVDHQPAEVAKAVQTLFASVEPAVLNAAIANVQKAMVPNGRITPAMLGNLQKLWIENGTLKQAIPFNAVFTHEYLPS